MKTRSTISRRTAAAGALFGALAAVLAGTPRAAAAPGFDHGAAIDVAGRQRMLTQRIVKAYCQVGLGVTPAVSRMQLGEAMRRFSMQLGWLHRGVPGGAQRAALARVAALWAPFRRIASGPVSRDGARQLVARDEALLGAAHEVVLALEQSAGTPQARLVNLSGRQRMLSQRLAKLYMLRAWEIDSAEQRALMDSASDEFGAALAALRSAPENSAAIARELEAVERQWEWFLGAIGLQGAQSYALVVADASESILNSMDLVTGLYAKLGRG